MDRKFEPLMLTDAQGDPVYVVQIGCGQGAILNPDGEWVSYVDHLPGCEHEETRGATFAAVCSCGIYSPRAPRDDWSVQGWLATHSGEGHIVEEVPA